MIGVIELLLGAEAHAVALLAVPPIVAGIGGTPEQTARIGLFSVVLAVIVQAIHATILSGEHLVELLIVSIASVLSVWNAHARQEAVAAERGGAVLADAMGVFGEGLEAEGMAQRLARVPVPDLASVCIVHLTDEHGRIEVAAIAAADPGSQRLLEEALCGSRVDRLSASPIAEASRLGQRRVFNRLDGGRLRHLAAGPDQLRVLRAVGPRSAVVLPLTDGRDTVGAVSLWSTADEKRFGPDEISLAEELCRRAAAGLINARLHEQQVKLVHALQGSLLPPRLPQVDGLEIGARFRAAGAGNAVGGDFYDVFPLSERSWGTVIGDVCGKGPEAAALTALMRDTLRVSGLRRESPCGALNLLNAAILDAQGSAMLGNNMKGRFCTSAYTRVDLNGSGELTVCNAGHPQPVLMKADGAVSRIGPPGTLLGIYDDIALTDTTARFDPGDMLVLFTDGLYEARPSTHARPIDVERIVESCRGLSADQAAAELESQAQIAQGGEAEDDIAVVVLKRS